MNTVIKLAFLFVLMLIAGQSWGLVVISPDGSHRYDESRIAANTKNYDYGAASNLRARGVQRSFESPENVEGRSFFTFIDAFIATKKGLGGNPFKGKTPQQIDDAFRKKGFDVKGTDPVAGKGSYINPKTGRKYYIDKGGKYVDTYRSCRTLMCIVPPVHRYPRKSCLWATDSLSEGSTVLTFEWDKDSEQLEIHADSEGLYELVKQINKLSRLEGNEHLHLMTEDWDGEELSGDKQNEKSELIHHVKIFKWVDE